MVKVIAESAGCELVEDGQRLYFVERSIGGLAIASFVLGLLCLIAAVNSVIWLVKGVLVAAAGLGVALVLGAGCALAVRAIRRRRATPPETLAKILVLDRSRGAACNERGEVYAPLEQIWFETRTQVTSSSRALACCWPSDSMVIARGSPFLGSVDVLGDALRQQGFRVS